MDYESVIDVVSPHPAKAQKGSRKIKDTSHYGIGQCAVRGALPRCFGKIPLGFGCAASAAAAIAVRPATGKDRLHERRAGCN